MSTLLQPQMTSNSSGSNSKLPGARCWECPLQNEPCVPASGPGRNPKLIVIGEAPGMTEVQQGAPFVGPSGTLLDYALKKHNVALDEVHRTNVVMCRPPANRDPSQEEVLACMTRLEMELDELGQAPVLIVGKTAAEAFGIAYEDRSKIINWGPQRAVHTFHPAFILRDPSAFKVFDKDLRNLLYGLPAVNPKWSDPEIYHVKTVSGLKKWLDTVPDGTWVGFDIETDQVRWYTDFQGKPPDPILMLQLAWHDEYAIVMDDEMLYDTPETIPVLQEFFNRVRTAAHNGKFDQIFLKHHLGLKVHLDFDTMLAHAILDENSKHGLKELTYEYFGIPDYEERLIKQYLNNRNDRYSKIPFEPFAKYGGIDVIMVLQFRKLFEEQLRAQGRLDWPFNNIIMRAANMFVDVEIRGIQIDVDQIYKVQKYLAQEMERIAEEAMATVGVTGLNMQSTQQVANIVYDMLGFPPPKSKKLPRRSTNHEAMLPHAGKHPFIDKLLEHRRIAKMKNSYADNIIEALDVNGAVHTSFQVNGTEIGRLSAKNPALQTIPRAEAEKDNKGFYGAMIKSSFVARPGKVLIVCDYSQAELRVAAVLANEPFLYDVYANDRDLHTEVAIAMYGSGWTKEQRVRTKMFNFSYLYGGNEYSFAMDAGLPITVARQFVADYNNVMPNLYQFRQEQYRLLCEQGYVQSPFGRRRHFEIITKANEDDARKSCVHAPIAGTASDLTLLAGCELEEEGYNVLLLVHDSVIFEVNEELATVAADHAQQVMESVASHHLPQVKWKADPEVSLRWSEPPTFMNSL
jgi:uracil-DNA glycosylase family 4